MTVQRVETLSGSIDVGLRRLDDRTVIETKTGDVTVRVPEDLRGPAFVEATVGRVRFHDGVHVEGAGSLDDVLGWGDAGPRLLVSTAVGNVDVVPLAA
ncbi:hypothetical protein [Haloarchaeobius amylolyticus]|uniref:hypothetical protein n=1 Tax=Haloarchaeobius amylolyticus TaxID=1198296 RepID=UPI00227171E8|nr:hypothetical protein [Haloarchaeobius amylolyticus]